MESKDITSRTRLKNKPPSSAIIILIILFGAGGLIGSLFYLTGDVKLHGYKLERWAVRDSSSKYSKPVLIDTLVVVFHSNIQLQKPLTKDIKADVDLDYKNVYLTYNPTFLIWMALISVMLALSLALMPVVLKYCRDIYKHGKLKKPDMAAAAGITIIIGVCIFFTNKISNVLNLFKLMTTAKILITTPGNLNVYIAVCLIAGLTAIFGQLLINYAVTNLPEDVFALPGDNEKKNAVAVFLLLKDRLKFFLAADAFLIVLSILTTDTLKRSIYQEISLVNIKNVKHELFPQEFVYLFGLTFTLYLALLYIPVYYRLKYKGETMVQNIDPSDDAQVKLASNFIIQESAVDSFKVALSILAPVVSSLLPGLIKF